jgi:3,4-dihydroxy 2-butanone 4-phosphate synthase/GTP cyclohydrolase II
MDDLISFARLHSLKMGTIRDLIAYRRRHDHLVECLAETPFTSDYGGDWRLLNYVNRVDGSQHLVLQKGKVRADEPTLVRMHSISIFSDTLGQPGPRKRLLQRCMHEVGNVGAGVIVLLMPQPEGGLTMMVQSGGKTPEMDLRNYGIGAQILADLGIHDMILLTNAHRNIVALDGYGINVVGERLIPEGE